MRIAYYIRFSLALFMLMIIGTSYAQQLKRTAGSAQIRMEYNMTTKQAYELAEQQAIINAIEQAFGTYVEQQTDMYIEDGRADYNIIGTTKVRGEWVETTDKQFKETINKETGQHGLQNVNYITCTVKGKVRKSLPKADIQFEILNCEDLSCRTLDFIDGEQLYLYFKSPVDGFVSVYIDEGDITYRLLPYVNMVDEYQSGVPVKADQNYLFFSETGNSFGQSLVDEIEMFTNKKIEYNSIYIVFAEKEFIKPVLEADAKVDGRILPKSLSTEAFSNWLIGNRVVLTSFQDRKIKISIKPNNN